MLVVEQTLTCDVCGVEINSLKQPVQAHAVLQLIDRPAYGVGNWKDVCQDCLGPLRKAFWAVKHAGG